MGVCVYVCLYVCVCVCVTASLSPEQQCRTSTICVCVCVCVTYGRVLVLLWRRCGTFTRATLCYGPVSVSVSVCLSPVAVLSKRMDESSWFLARELPSTHPTLCQKEILVSSKLRVLPSGTLFQSPDFLVRYICRRNVLST